MKYTKFEMFHIGLHRPCVIQNCADAANLDSTSLVRDVAVNNVMWKKWDSKIDSPLRGKYLHGFSLLRAGR